MQLTTTELLCNATLPRERKFFFPSGSRLVETAAASLKISFPSIFQHKIMLMYKRSKKKRRKDTIIDTEGGSLSGIMLPGTKGVIFHAKILLSDNQCKGNPRYL